MSQRHCCPAVGSVWHDADIMHVELKSFAARWTAAVIQDLVRIKSKISFDVLFETQVYIAQGISYFHNQTQWVYPIVLAGNRFYEYHGVRVKRIFFTFKVFFNRVQCLFPIVLSGSQDPVRFVRPVARQNSGRYTLRMIVKVANSSVTC